MLTNMMMMMMVYTVVMVMTFSGVSADNGQCEERSIPMCKEIGYNLTRFPNQFNHESQDEVRKEIPLNMFRLFRIEGPNDSLCCRVLTDDTSFYVDPSTLCSVSL